MDYIRLGNTGIEVSRLCFGALTIGPLQANLPVEDGARVIAEAIRKGVSFIDTADLYGTYAHIKRACEMTGRQPAVSSKSYAYAREQAEKSLEKARKELARDIIDIFMLHEQESRLTLKGHREALDYYLSMREKGRIRAVGVSAHNIEVIEACAEMPEIDVVHPIVNIKGIGIGDGAIDEMLEAVKMCYEAGKGIYAMKPLGGGNLYDKPVESLGFVLKNPFIHSIAVGMQSIEEVGMNVRIFEGRDIPDKVFQRLKSKKRKLHIEYWCEGCGRCVERCGTNALRLDRGKAVADPDKCVLCGYCGSVCPAFAIKII